MDRRVAALDAILRGMESVVVAYSGGVDSALLARVAHDALGDRALAVIARSPSLPARELDEATELAAEAGFRLRVVDTGEVANPVYAANPTDRCYYCKAELFDQLEQVRKAMGFRWIAYGENQDDSADYRPGARAAREQGVRAPLREAGLTKADVRELARRLGLRVWSKPAAACLSSRFPYGIAITPERLAQVESAEETLRRLGFRQCRVRYHGDVARVEVTRTDMDRALELAEVINAGIRGAGFAFVALDLAGYRRGSLNPPALIRDDLPVI